MEPGKISRLLSEGYDFKFGDYISKAWKMLSANAGTFIVFVLIIVVVSLIAQLIPFIGRPASAIILTPAFSAGYWYLARQADQDGHAELNTGFQGFSELGKIIPVILLKMVVLSVAAIPFILVVGVGLYSWYEDLQLNPTTALDNLPTFGLIGFVLALIPFYFMVSYLFALPLVLFKNMGAWEAMEASRKIVSKKWFAFFGLLFVAGFIAGLGLLLLVIGVLFTASMSSLATYSAYKDIVGFDNEDEEDDEIDHLIA